MACYHKSKREAIASVQHLEKYWDIDASFEPYNGWNAVLRPLSKAVYKYPLEPLLDIAVLDLGWVERRPPEYKKPPSHESVLASNKAKRVAKPVAPPPPPPKPPSAKAAAVLPPKPPPPPPPR